MDRIYEIKELIKTLCRIPAPSNMEHERALFCRGYLEDAGASNVFIDDDDDVIFEWGLSDDRPVTVFTAHLDTVFPDLEPFSPVEEDGKIFCPGVGDDTANVALLMYAVKELIKEGISIKDTVICLNSGEEGLGNLRGARALMERYRGRVKEFVSFDGGYTAIANEAVGSRRFRVKVKTEGGHSFGNFGNLNAVAAASQLISALYTVKVPDIPGKKTTYNVGVIKGGTSVNTIAEDAEFLYEFRSDSAKGLSLMDGIFESLLSAFDRSLGERGGISSELIGERPCSDIRQSLMDEVTERYISLIMEVTGGDVRTVSSSTDCNIPLSMGVRAVCFGGYLGKGSHTRSEYIEIDSLGPGYEIIRKCLLQGM